MKAQVNVGMKVKCKDIDCMLIGTGVSLTHPRHLMMDLPTVHLYETIGRHFVHTLWYLTSKIVRGRP